MVNGGSNDWMEKKIYKLKEGKIKNNKT